jgi:multiple sugar transport system substrate-binding protein
MKSRSLTLLICSSLLTLILAACGGAPAAAPGATSAPAGSDATAAPAGSDATAAPAGSEATTAPTASGATAAPAATAAAAEATPAPLPTLPVPDQPAAPVSQSGFQGTLQYWVLGYQPNGGNRTGQLMDAAVASFMKNNPDIKIEITGYTGDQAGFTKLTQAVQTGQAVDVFRLPSDILPLLVRDGLVAPIDPFLSEEDKADIYPNLLQAVSIDGQAYAWPLWVPPVGMYLNLDIFEERGVEVPPKDWTYTQFVEIAKELTFTRDNGEQVYGYTALIDPGVVNAWPFILGDGALPLNQDNTAYSFDTPEAAAGLKKLVDLAQVHKVTPPDFGAQTGADITAGFKDKKVYAMYSEPSGASSGYKAAGLNFDVWPMPIGSSGKMVTAGGIGLISVAATDDQAKLQAAMDLARYLTSAEVGTDVEGFYLAPGARKSVKVADPISKFEPFVESTYITPIIADWPQIRTLIHPQIQNAIFGEISPEEALVQPASEVNSILGGQ